MSNVLLTGFQGYGGRGINPAGEVVKALDGSVIEGATVSGLLLPVSYARTGALIEAEMARLRPAVVVSLGLWPAEPVIRIERVGVNRAAFEIADNEGTLPLDEPVEPGGPAARMATLPVAAIIRALRDKGIPARPSDTAGTFLCNATLYRVLGIAERLGLDASCGFVHVPYLPQQVADLLDDIAQEARLELHQRADLASMSGDMMVEAVRETIAVSLRAR